MSRPLNLDVPDEIFAVLDSEARAAGVSIQAWTVDVLAQRSGRMTQHSAGNGNRGEALADLLQHLGTVAVGHPDGADNAAIDRDLAREYESTHKAG